VRHLILVSQGNLYFFANLDLQVRPGKPLTTVPTVLALMERLRRIRPISSPIPILGKHNRDSGLERFLDRAVMHVLNPPSALCQSLSQGAEVSPQSHAPPPRWSNSHLGTRPGSQHRG